MQFQTKLLWTYSLLVVFLVLVFGVVFYRYSATVFERNAASNYQLLASKMGRQLDDVVRPMDFISSNLISDARFKTALENLANLDRRDPLNGVSINESLTTVHVSLMTYSILKNFHGVVFFDRRGDFFSSNFVEHTRTSAAPGEAAALRWTEEAQEAGGRPLILAPYDDPWTDGPRARVFGFVRAMPGLGADELGFLEVQKAASVLDAVFETPQKDAVRVLAFKADGEVFYRGEELDAAALDGYRRAAKSLSEHPRFAYNPQAKEDELVVGDVSEYSGITVVLALSRRVLLQPLQFARWTAAAAAAAMLAVALAISWFASRRLTRTLRLLQRRIEQTELENLPVRTSLDHSSDELAALDEAFHSLNERLDEALRAELHSRTAWMRARLDSLQAQIDPHFLYNILTVIAGKGFERGDEEIGRICEGIASMLRYSTSTAERSATLAEELAHVKTYLFLMRMRFEERLDFEVSADESVLDVRLPKITLQQLAENCLVHGFGAGKKPMRVSVRCRDEGALWSVEIRDDGAGFPAGKLEELREKLTALNGELIAGQGGEGMGIGGMGIMNTYARLHLFFQGDFRFELADAEGGGALVVLRGPRAAADGEA